MSAGRETAVTELPDNIDLQWIGRQIIALQRETRGLRDDIGVMAAILRRVENNQTADRDEWRGLFDAIRHVRGRVETLEGK
jgi:hypothetical protein